MKKTTQSARSVALKMVANGDGHTAVAQELNRLGLKTKQGKSFTPQMIWRILKPTTKTTGVINPISKANPTKTDMVSTTQVDTGVPVIEVVRAVNFCGEVGPKTKQMIIGILLLADNSI